MPELGDHHLLRSLGRISAEQLLFVNVGDLYEFDYDKIRSFASDSLAILAQIAPSTRHLAMTIHGVGYGLDEAEAFRSQLAGYLDAIEIGKHPIDIERITIVERNKDRVQRLQSLLDQALPDNTVTIPANIASRYVPKTISRSSLTNSTVGSDPAYKPHILVAMAFAEEVEDYYYYGIQAPVNSFGYLCERANLSADMGNGFERLESRIETASVVIADLTDKNPNVFLTLGYAWGKNRPTILLMRDEQDDIPFDTREQRCLTYRRIRDLEESLRKEIQLLTDNTR